MRAAGEATSVYRASGRTIEALDLVTYNVLPMISAPDAVTGIVSLKAMGTYYPNQRWVLFSACFELPGMSPIGSICWDYKSARWKALDFVKGIAGDRRTFLRQLSEMAAVVSGVCREESLAIPSSATLDSLVYSMFNLGAIPPP